jgi:hypothetical protein
MWSPENELRFWETKRISKPISRDAEWEKRKKKRKERKRKIHQRPSNPHPPSSEGQKSNRAIGN